jgi:preprotein translocase subunit SecE
MLGVRIPPGLPWIHSRVGRKGRKAKGKSMERTGKLVMNNKLQQSLESTKGLWTKTTTFFTEVSTEIKKVTWPTLKEVRDTTIVVLIAIFIFGIFLYLVDLGLGHALKYLFKRSW